MNEQDTILNEITRKQLIWCGHVERMDPTRLPKIMINWKPEEGKKRGRPRKNLERWETQGVTGGMCETSGECSLGQTIPI